MLDIKKIKENPDAVKAGLRARKWTATPPLTVFWSWTQRSAP